MAIERSENLSNKVTEGRKSVRAEEERVEHYGWIVNSNYLRQLLTEIEGLGGRSVL